MSGRTDDHRHQSVAQLAAEFVYPETPDVTAAVIQRLQHRNHSTQTPVRRLAWAAVILLLLLASLWAVPPVRAAVQQFLRIGAIGVQVVEPTALATAIPSPTEPPPWDLDLAGETTLAAAREQVDFDLRLPGYPTDLGSPDRVYVQELGGPVVILVWLAPMDTQKARMSLTLFGPGAFAEKTLAFLSLLEETNVRGARALWMEGEHLLRFEDDDFQPVQLVAGNVLVWTEETADGVAITYRLESELSLAEAVQVAESLR